MVVEVFQNLLTGFYDIEDAVPIYPTFDVISQKRIRNLTAMVRGDAGKFNFSKIFLEILPNLTKFT